MNTQLIKQQKYRFREKGPRASLRDGLRLPKERARYGYQGRPQRHPEVEQLHVHNVPDCREQNRGSHRVKLDRGSNRPGRREGVRPHASQH